MFARFKDGFPAPRKAPVIARHAATTAVAIIGPGNIGIDLMVKIERLSRHLRCAAIAGRHPDSDGLKRARSLGIATTHEGIEGLRALPGYADVEIVFDATSAGAHRGHSAAIAADGKRIIDLTPAAIGPFCVPSVNLDHHLGAPNINMVTCGGQAAIPMVAAVARVTPVHRAELVARIAAGSAGPGTLANIDAFRDTTARAIEGLGGARSGAADIVLDFSDPPGAMRDRIVCRCDEADPAAIRASIDRMVSVVQAYVPGYRLERAVSVAPAPAGLEVTILLEVRGAGHHLPAHAGNLDIMTSAALRTAETLAAPATRTAGPTPRGPRPGRFRTWYERTSLLPEPPATAPSRTRRSS